MRRTLFPAFVVAAILGLPSVSTAAPLCSTVSDLSTACLVNRGNTLSLVPLGTLVVPNSGNDQEGTVEAALQDVFGQVIDITLLAKSDASHPGFTFGGLPGKIGTWSYSGSASLAYMTVKAANSFLLYNISSLTSGSWSTLGILNNGGNQPNVSHISFWTAPNVSVPEPATLLLLSSGLALIAYRRRRKV